MARRSSAKIAGEPAKKPAKQSALGRAAATAGKVKTAASTVKKAAQNIKAAVENEIIPEVVDSLQAIQAIRTDSDYSVSDRPIVSPQNASSLSGGYGGLPLPSEIDLRGLTKIAPLLNVDPFDPDSFAAAGHVEMSKPEYDETKAKLEGYGRRLETVQLGMQVLKNTIKLASAGADVATEHLNYGIKYQGIETKQIELQIAESGTVQAQSKLDQARQKEQFLAGENVTSGQMLNMKLQKLSLLAQQQAADLRQTREQTRAIIGSA